MDGSRTRARRREGRWVRDGEPASAAHRLLRGFWGRSWVLLAPLLGMAWAHSSHVRPDVAALESVSRMDLQRALDREDALRVLVSAEQGETETVLAEIEALHLPRVLLRQTVLDSLARWERSPRFGLARLQARVDSLRTLNDYLAADLAAVDRSLADQRALLANLQGWQAALGDSLARVEQLLAANAAEAERGTRRNEVHAALSRAWYLFGPAIGMLWTRNS
ncbi:MAG: hypothetical protein FJY75_09430 [Candidatus Eisenbacteria bacterium]|uniref:Uncharacterized protein n=1 Tax=Eiseniibacteriota bacterium TaxID=2212470 RepID=A0A937XDR2_UNCEI|nr:hypothetical protein [Candidatus Eisenbacteria bacterium]